MAQLTINPRMSNAKAVYSGMVGHIMTGINGARIAPGHEQDGLVEAVDVQITLDVPEFDQVIFTIWLGGRMVNISLTQDDEVTFHTGA